MIKIPDQMIDVTNANFIEDVPWKLNVNNDHVQTKLKQKNHACFGHRWNAIFAQQGPDRVLEMLVIGQDENPVFGV